MQESTTNFGYEQVSFAEKTAKVKQVFQNVASKYDLMNDLMSFGIHRWWKQQAIAHCGLRAQQSILDLAGGTGDLARLMAPIIGGNGLIVIADINATMLEVGRTKLVNHGLLQPITYVQTNAECLSLPDNYFDCVTIAFGLRNVTHKELAIGEMFRVLKPGGRVVILEFSHISNELFKTAYDTYAAYILPLLGKHVAGDQASYQYLVESIRMHPSQHELLAMVQQAGFENCNYTNLLQGLCAIHKGFKF